MTDSSSSWNWSGNLDSSDALRKHLHTKELASEWPLNSDWQLARDPMDHTVASAKKSIVSLPKKVERIIWAKPSMVELTKAAVRTERAKATAIKFHEKMQAMKAQQEKLPEKSPTPKKPLKPLKPQKPQRAPLWQPKTVPQQVDKKPPAKVHRRPCSVKKTAKKAVKASAATVAKPSFSEVSAKRIPSSVSRTLKPKPVRRRYSGRPSNILVVDAQTNPGLSRPHTGGAEQPMDSNGGQAPGRSGNRSYGVPLCTRPTKILGMGIPYSRHLQMRQQQLYQQPEYRDQYMRMLHRQQRELERFYGQSRGDSMDPDQHKQPIQRQGQPRKKYAVPANSPLKGLWKGKRLCGNFYYD
ncbi:hypothetical protein KR054_011964 [Drosophila jambulina]|nr:hypothetical protein KR054_011964 [Drosophila jambulina]